MKYLRNNKRLIATVITGLALASCGGSGDSSSDSSAATAGGRTKNAALTTVPTADAAKSCADGGTCKVGDKGPGGGTVFYVGASKVNAAGEKFPGGSNMEFLDSNPSPSVAFDCTVDIAGTERGLGAGANNTTLFKEKCPRVVRSLIITTTWDDGKNGKSDWFIPSYDELNLICRFTRGQSTDTTEKCNGKLPVTVGGNFAGTFWSSTQHSKLSQYALSFQTGDEVVSRKVLKNRFLIVRAF